MWFRHLTSSIDSFTTWKILAWEVNCLRKKFYLPDLGERKLSDWVYLPRDEGYIERDGSEDTRTREDHLAQGHSSLPKG